FNNNTSAALINVTGLTVTNQTVAATISVGGTQPLSITNNGAPGINTLTFTGGVNATTAGRAITVDGSSNTTISGAIGGNIGTLTKNGTGLLDLSPSAGNTYTGGTVINGGTIRFTNNNQLGAAAGGVTLNGGTLHVAADIFVDR